MPAPRLKIEILAPAPAPTEPVQLAPAPAPTEPNQPAPAGTGTGTDFGPLLLSDKEFFEKIKGNFVRLKESRKFNEIAQNQGNLSMKYGGKNEFRGIFPIF